MQIRNILLRGIVAATAAGMLFSGASAVSAQDQTGMYRSELTNEWISDQLMNQRPVAVMVDNESIALPHYGTAEGDVVYELMNSTANDRISRLMVILKDWAGITQMGNVRSTRPANIPLAAEWNAVLCHDGGPFYVDAYFAKPYAAQHFSGGFGRVNNGKATEFTEYVLSGDLQAKFAATGFPSTYNEFRNTDTSHFNFASDQEVILSSIYGGGAHSAQEITVPFYHNGSALRYNPQTRTYDYYEYGTLHTDAEDNQVLTFKNLLIQDCDFVQLDENGYMEYQVVGSNMPGYYVTNGEAIQITWTKSSETDLTRYYDAAGNEIQINTGKTYIALIPSDTWYDVGITG